ncbi:MAG: zf-HC2 domain-containing protein [Acidimicrobiia bacterium]|nr:zf-HC2 domain-containing protein [Acidimicrobiia bacterium]
MHDHDFDLIAAYADGTASAEEIDAARRAMATCAECSEEYTAQVNVLEVLRSAPAVVMTEMERHALHRSLAGSLPNPGRQVGWFSKYAPRVAAVAAGFAVVGLASVAMLGQFSGGDSAETMSLDSIAADLAGNSEERLEADMPTAEEAPTDAGSDGSFTDDMAMTQESATALPDAQDVLGYAMAFTSTDLEDLANGGDLEAFRLSRTDESEKLLTQCADELPEGHEIQATVLATYEELPAYIVVYSSGGDTVAAAYSSEDCTLLAEFVAPQ